VEPPEDPAVRAAQVVLVVLESPGVRVALVVLEKSAEPVGREAPVVSESPGVREVRVVPESPVLRAAQVALESPVVRVAPENSVVQAGPQPEQKLAVAEPAPSRPRSPAEAVALTVSAVINPQRAAAAAALSAEEAGHLPKRPAIAVAAVWEVAAKAEAAAVVEVAAKKEAEGDAAAKRDERTKNIQTKNYELIKTSVPCVSADGFQFCLCQFNSGAAVEIGCRDWSAVQPKTIQHTKRSG